MYVHTFALSKSQKLIKMNKTKALLLAGVMLVAGVANAQTTTKTKKVTKTTVAAAPTNWTVDPSHSSVKFTVPHMSISEVEGRFGTFTGTIASPTADFEN